ncbi:MAG: cytochrome-c peroxidase [Thiolinea sp.]
MENQINHYESRLTSRPVTAEYRGKKWQSTLWLSALLPLIFTIHPVSAEEPLRALPAIEALELDEKKVKLGQRLFSDPRLSRDNTISCASCHNLEKGGVDSLQHSIGIDGQTGDINAPTIFNTAYNFRLFWDGRANSLEEQVSGPVHHPKEMGSSWEEILEKLTQDEKLLQDFAAVFDEELAPEHIESVIAEFQRSLITPSRFDRYLRGDETAITENELLGYKKFKSYGCIACHQGVNVGGNMFQKFGVMGDYFDGADAPAKVDLGRFNVTGREADKHVFKVPGLRNIALTAPYFHNGSVKTLPEAIDVMFKFQLGRPAPEEDKALIVAFLKTLTGETLEKPTEPVQAENKQ